MPADEVLAEKRTGKQVLNLPARARRRAVCGRPRATHVAVIGDNRKLLVFPLAQVPEMARGRGVILQKYNDGGLGDAQGVPPGRGLSWRQGERTRTETDARGLARRARQAAASPPHGFPKSGKFG